MNKGLQANNNRKSERRVSTGHNLSFDLSKTEWTLCKSERKGLGLTGTPKRAARFLRLSNSSGSTSSALGAARFFPFEGAGCAAVVRFARASSCSAVYDDTLVE